MVAWYDRAFGSWYLRLYPHRDRAEAERAVETVREWLPRRGRLLDVGCGTGRHLEVLAAQGYATVGLDRSPELLRRLANTTKLRGRVVRGDMRVLPFAPGTFASLISMFTSFGYFESRRAHEDLLREFARVVEGGGKMVLDYLNEPLVRGRIVPCSIRTVDGFRIEERRSIRSLPDDGEAVVKQVRIQNGSGSTVEEFEERVALYSRSELLTMLGEAGWRKRRTLGDYEGRAWGVDSPRLIVLAEKGKES